MTSTVMKKYQLEILLHSDASFHVPNSNEYILYVLISLILIFPSDISLYSSMTNDV